MPTEPPTGSRERRGALFADVCDSTRLYEELGDERARELVLGALEVVRRAGETHGGRVVDRIGDELFQLFPTATSLVRAAVEIQTRLLEAVDLGDLPPAVALRVGCHFGSVLLDGEVFGETVYIAKRAATTAKAGQIVTTRETLAEVDADEELQTRFLERVRLKGRTGESELHEVLYGSSATVGLDLGAVLARRRPRVLTLRLGGEAHEVSPSRPRVTIGRDARCDVVVRAEGVSRIHARVELDKGRFRLVDVSTNGSSVEREGAEPEFVRRDWCLLDGSGALVLAPDTSADPPRLAFSVSEADGT